MNLNTFSTTWPPYWTSLFGDVGMLSTTWPPHSNTAARLVRLVGRSPSAAMGRSNLDEAQTLSIATMGNKPGVPTDLGKLCTTPGQPTYPRS